MKSAELLAMLSAQDSDLAAEIGHLPLHDLAREIVALWNIVGVEKRRDFMAAEAARKTETERMEHEAAAEQEARWSWIHANRTTWNFTPDWSSPGYLHMLARARLRNGLTSRPDLQKYEQQPEPAHMVRRFLNSNLAASVADSDVILGGKR